ncbi:MAG: LL-diaminopimelate aminotransferase [Chlamydiales bacterium]
MVKRNKNFSLLKKNYLFSQMRHHTQNVDDLINLSIGNTSEPIPSMITHAMEQAANRLSSRSGYTGYGESEGHLALREKISEVIYQHRVSAEEIFISDGAKCDIGRLQILFSGSTIAVQNPTYPVYLDTGLFLNQSIVYMDCLPENHFFPDTFPKADIIYLCSPNNPTGSVISFAKLKKWIQKAKENHAFIIFDAAYAGFIRDHSLPRSIYEIEGADQVAIEVSSFSKFIGFTGVRLGWSVIPYQLKYRDGGSVQKDFSRIVTTFFNGASNIAQAGGLAALNYPQEIQKLSDYYLENARLIKQAIALKGLTVYGGEHAPYLWVNFGHHKSWEIFQMLLEETRVVATPGLGFGSCGEGFLRFSAFGHRELILKAIKRIQTKWPKQLSLLPI